MTANSITAEQHEVDCQHDCADADPKPIWKPERLPNIVGKNHKEQDREVKKVAMNVLHDERKRTLAPITFPRFADCARGRISPERFIVGAAIVITRQPESPRRPKNE